MDMELLDILEKANEEETLTTITMSMAYYIKKYDRNVNTVFTLIRKGLKELEKYKELKYDK